MRAGVPEDQVDTSEGTAEVGGAVLASSGTEHNAGGATKAMVCGSLKACNKEKQNNRC